jgi:diguanylate cyclase (GGDEF)-like protein/PAS domain S-box-containing protein
MRIHRSGHAPPRKNARLALLAVGVPALALIAMAWLFAASLMRLELQQTIRSAYRENANLALAFEQHTLRTLRATDQLLSFLAHQYVERGHVRDLHDLVKTAGIDSDLITTVAILDARGVVVAASRDVAGADLANRDYFRRHRDSPPPGLAVGAPIPGRLSGGPTFPVSRRMERAGGRFAGVAVVGLNPNYFADFYKKIDIGRNGMVLLIGADGITLARRAGSLTSFGQDMSKSTLMREQAAQDVGEFLSAGRVEGVNRYTSYRALREYGLVLAVGTSVDEVLAPYREHRSVYMGTAAAFTLLVLLSAALILASLARRRQQLDQHLRDEARFRATFDQAAVGVAHVALDGTVLKVNDKLCRMSGYTASELRQRKFIDFKPPEDRQAADDIRTAQLEHGSNVQREARFLRKDGTLAWYAVSVSLVLDPEGKPDYFIAILQDVTEARQAQEQVLYQAQHDPLTRLPNRALFQDRLEQALRLARRRRWSAGLLFLDLDYFKQVNDRLGHVAGDALLVEVGARLAGAVRASDTAARIGGDEFAVVLTHLNRPDDAALVAGKILTAMAAPIVLQGQEYAITVSIGIAVYPDHGTDADALLKSADTAMFKAKQGGRNSFEVFAAKASPRGETV